MVTHGTGLLFHWWRVPPRLGRVLLDHRKGRRRPQRLWPPHRNGGGTRSSSDLGTGPAYTKTGFSCQQLCPFAMLCLRCRTILHSWNFSELFWAPGLLIFFLDKFGTFFFKDSSRNNSVFCLNYLYYLRTVVCPYRYCSLALPEKERCCLSAYHTISNATSSASSHRLIFGHLY